MVEHYGRGMSSRRVAITLGLGRTTVLEVLKVAGVEVRPHGSALSAPREAHHREGHEMFTVDAVIAAEERVFAMVDAADTRARLDVRAVDLAGLSVDQARAIAASAHSPYLVQPLQAPAGAGKTHSLRALRSAAHRTTKEVLVLAPTGKAVDEAMRDEVGDRGLIVAKALCLARRSSAQLDRRTVIVVDEPRWSACLARRRRWPDRGTAAGHGWGLSSFVGDSQISASVATTTSAEMLGGRPPRGRSLCPANADRSGDLRPLERTCRPACLRVRRSRRAQAFGRVPQARSGPHNFGIR